MTKNTSTHEDNKFDKLLQYVAAISFTLYFKRIGLTDDQCVELMNNISKTIQNFAGNL